MSFKSLATCALDTGVVCRLLQHSSLKIFLALFVMPTFYGPVSKQVMGDGLVFQSADRASTGRRMNSVSSIALQIEGHFQQLDLKQVNDDTGAGTEVITSP